jgi:predicted dehydrogenase
MHPWEDHRLGYAARADLGGGVLLTLCHPFDYLRWLLGEIGEVLAIAARPRSSNGDVEDCVEVGLMFRNGASGHVHLDFVQRPREHRLTIIGTAGTLTWSDGDHVARRFCPESKHWEVFLPPDGYQRNDMFVEEMRHFLACLRGDERPFCTLRDGVEALEIALAAKQCLTRTLPAPQTT